MTTANPMEEFAAALAPFLERQKARQFGVGYKHDVSSLSPSVNQYSHGPGGSLSFPGVDPVVFNTVLGPRSILGSLPAVGRTDTNPTYLTITGVDDVSGSEPILVCDPAPTAGLMRACLTTSVFGRYSRQTPEIDISRLGKVNDRADPMDLQLIGSPIDAAGIFSAGARNPTTPSDVLVNETSRKFWEMNVAFHRLLTRQIWQGRPSNGNGAGYKEITGLDILISTGYKDAELGTLCPAVDSLVYDFGQTAVGTNPTNTVAAITNAYWQLKDRATRLSLDPVRWIVAMRAQMFYELTALWPCAYMTYRCQLQGQATQFIDATDQIRMRDEMRAGRYLMIDGERVEVTIDDGIAETSHAPASFNTTIYFVPMSVVGGRAVTYLEYFQYDNASIREAIGNMALARVEGAFLTWPRQTNNCLQWQTLVEPRLVLRTPFLAAKIANIMYQPMQHEQDAFPGDAYAITGGSTSRRGPSFFSHWQS